MHDYDCVTRRAIFRNADQRKGHHQQNHDQLSQEGDQGGRGFSKVIQKASSLTIDFEQPSKSFHMVQLSGSWARERYIEETKLSHGMRSFGSTRGVSGHQHNPFAGLYLFHFILL